MEYFGSRLVWAPLENIVEPDDLNVDVCDERPDNEDGTASNPVPTSQLDEIPNEIEYSK